MGCGSHQLDCLGLPKRLSQGSTQLLSSALAVPGGRFLKKNCHQLGIQEKNDCSKNDCAKKANCHCATVGTLHYELLWLSVLRQSGVSVRLIHHAWLERQHNISRYRGG